MTGADEILAIVIDGQRRRIAEWLHGTELFREWMRLLNGLQPTDAMPVMRPRQVAVYVILGADESVIYVGQTANPKGRMDKHRSVRGVVERVAWFVAEDRSTALLAEELFVAQLYPRDNQRLTNNQGDEHPRGVRLTELVVA